MRHLCQEENKTRNCGSSFYQPWCPKDASAGHPHMRACLLSSTEAGAGGLEGSGWGKSRVRALAFPTHTDQDSRLSKPWQSLLYVHGKPAEK